MAIIETKDLSYIYGEGTTFAKKALDNVNISINEGEFIGLIGHTGSGKSTLVQHLNGLLKPSKGAVFVDGKDISKLGSKLRSIRQEVGLVFQYPEYQLFEETIIKDVSFGPINLGLDEEEIDRRVKDAIETVGLSYEIDGNKSPFEISGGQKRRVAIAGILAMEPRVLILDEPTAGLDPAGRDEILNEIYNIYKKKKITIIIVSHSMEDIANLANRIIVMNEGKVFMDGEPREIFKHKDELESIGLGVPQVTSFMRMLKDKGLDVDSSCITVKEAKDILINLLRGKANV
jgi:energy-coupling factor transport system ATP-binding protein